MVKLSALSVLTFGTLAAAQQWGNWGSTRSAGGSGLTTPGAPWGTQNQGSQNQGTPNQGTPNQGNGGPPRGPQCVVSVIIYTTEGAAQKRTRTRTRTEIRPTTIFTVTSVEEVETIVGERDGVQTTRTRTRTRERATSYVTTKETVETRTIIQDRNEDDGPGGVQTMTTSLTSCR